MSGPVPVCMYIPAMCRRTVYPPDRVPPDMLQAAKKAHTRKEWTNHIMQTYAYSIFPYVGIIQIRFNRSKFDYFLSACSTSSLL